MEPQSCRPVSGSFSPFCWLCLGLLAVCVCPLCAYEPVLPHGFLPTVTGGFFLKLSQNTFTSSPTLHALADIGGFNVHLCVCVLFLPVSLLKLAGLLQIHFLLPLVSMYSFGSSWCLSEGFGCGPAVSSINPAHHFPFWGPSSGLLAPQGCGCNDWKRLAAFRILLSFASLHRCRSQNFVPVASSQALFFGGISEGAQLISFPLCWLCLQACCLWAGFIFWSVTPLYSLCSLTVSVGAFVQLFCHPTSSIFFP